MAKQKNALGKTKSDWSKIATPAILGLLGVLATAVLGCVGTVLVAWIQSSSQATAITTPSNLSTPTKNLPTITYQMLDFNVITDTDMSIYGKGNGDEYVGISPVQCYTTHSSLAIEPQNEVKMTYNFIVISDKPIIISDISLHMDKYSPPPAPTSFTKGILVLGRGGGEVANFDLSNATIGKNFQPTSLNGGKAYRIEENDTVAFSTTFYFIEQGEYQLHMELKIETYAGESFAYTSKPVNFTWLYMDNLENLTITDGFSEDEVTLSSSSCT